MTTPQTNQAVETCVMKVKKTKKDVEKVPKKEMECFKFEKTDVNRARDNHTFIKVGPSEGNPDVIANLGNLVITGAVIKWTKDIDNNTPDQRLFIYSTEHRLAGAPADIKRVLRNTWSESSVSDDVIENALRKCISFTNYNKSKATEFAVEIATYTAGKKNKTKLKSNGKSKSSEIPDFQQICRALENNKRGTGDGSKLGKTKTKRESTKEHDDLRIQLLKVQAARDSGKINCYLDVSKFGSNPSIRYGKIIQLDKDLEASDTKSKRGRSQLKGPSGLPIVSKNANAFKQAMEHLGTNYTKHIDEYALCNAPNVPDSPKVSTSKKQTSHINEETMTKLKQSF